MLTLNAADLIYGIAQNDVIVTVSIFGDELTVSGGTDSFKLLYQGQLTQAGGTIATVGAGKQWLIRSIHVVNNSGGSQQWFRLGINGSEAANLITPTQVNVAAGGWAVYSNSGWQSYDTNGQLLTVGAQGPTGATGPTGPPVYLAADPGEEGWPGKPGDTGPQGITGAQGPAGPAVFLQAEPGEEGWPGKPGVDSTSLLVLDKTGTRVDVTGTSVAETNLYSFSIPGGTLSTNNRIECWMWGNISDTTLPPSITFKVYYGAASITLISATPNINAGSGGFIIHFSVTGAGATGSNGIAAEYREDIPPTGQAATTPFGGIHRVLVTATAEDSTVARTLKITVTLAAGTNPATVSLFYAMTEALR